jgi:1-aminocyclopropane-1-carboxylate deaminase/D-cysteine desulfhydrase-like pyridoxal-dependent ACC family enzyme
VFAAGAARLGLRCVLLLRGDGRAAPAGNLLLDLLFGAEVHWIETGDPYDPAVLERLQALAAGAGRRARIVQLPGEAGPLAAAAAASLAVEIAEQCEPEAIWHVAGSGLTAAGLALGCEALGLPARVQVVSVQQPREFIEPLIRRRRCWAWTSGSARSGWWSTIGGSGRAMDSRRERGSRRWCWRRGSRAGCSTRSIPARRWPD